MTEKIDLVDECVRKGSKYSKSMDYIRIGKLTNNIIDSFSGKKTWKPADSLKMKKMKMEDLYEEKEYSNNEENFKGSVRNLPIDKMWKKVSECLKGFKSLHKRVAQKYGIDNDTALAWIVEFKKFFTLMLIESYRKIKWNCYPSSIVECVWTTYIELGRYFRNFSTKLFSNQIMYPKSVLKADEEDYESKFRINKTLIILVYLVTLMFLLKGRFGS